MLSNTHNGKNRRHQELQDLRRADACVDSTVMGYVTRLDRVRVFGDALTFLIPHEWIEGQSEDDHYLYHLPEAESGWLRVSLISIEVPKENLSSRIPFERTAHEPLLRFLYAGRARADEMNPSLAPALDEARTFEHVEMARDGWKRNTKRPGQSGYAPFAVA